MKKTVKKYPFSGRVLFLGMGAVAQNLLSICLKRMDIDWAKVTIIDMKKKEGPDVTEALKRGAKFVAVRIEPGNFEEVISMHAGKGDLIIDLTWNIETLDLLQLIEKIGANYINTSVEVWDPYDRSDKKLHEQTLYHRQMMMRETIGDFCGGKRPTMILDHGANPGMVSHLTKELIKKIWKERRKGVKRPAHFSEAAADLGIRVIHISERDSQKDMTPFDPNTFPNTWSVEGFYEEGTAPAELGYGSHEEGLPHNGLEFSSGPKNEILLRATGYDVQARSWVPSGPITGYIIRHGEAFSISEYLTHKKRGKEYRPTVHYVYCPSEQAQFAIAELDARNYRMLPKTRIMRDEITEGRDELGVMIFGIDPKAKKGERADYGYWYGSTLAIDEAREMTPHHNATTLQVAGAVFGAMIWMIENPEKGILLPDWVDEKGSEQIFGIASEFWAPLEFHKVQWRPEGEGKFLLTDFLEKNGEEESVHRDDFLK